MSIETWLKSGAYLPPMMRDFHDQKDVFKALYDTIVIPERLKHVSWVDAHIFTIDIFLWWMARRGYTLQKCRADQPFADFDKTVSDATERRAAQMARMLSDYMAKGSTPDNGEAK